MTASHQTKIPNFMKKIKYVALALCTLFALEGTAQTVKSAYFLDGTFENFKLNPAMKAERGFFSPGVGNLSLGTNGNVGISHFLFPKDDHLTTFMSGTVSQEQFLDRLPQSIRFGMNFDETLLAFGFRLFGGYTSFSVSMHSNTSIALPKGFFEFAKKGFQESAYNFSGINLQSTNYAAATLGYSHEVIDGLRVGANLKYLVGLAYADVTFDRFNVEFSEEQWMLEAHAKAQAGVGIPVSFKDGDMTIENIQVGPYTPAATGLAVDLGVVYDMENIVPGLTLSGSILDLGKINWQYTMAIENNNTPLRWEGLREANINNIEGAIEEEFGKIGEDLEQMMELKVYDIQASTMKLSPTMYLGVEYNIPFYRKLSFAALYGKQFSPYSYSGWTETRGYVNWAPIKWLELSANAGSTTFGTSYGWMLNFHPRLISFFIGSDYMVTHVTSQYIPLPINDLNYHITIGLTKPIGKRK